MQSSEDKPAAASHLIDKAGIQISNKVISAIRDVSNLIGSIAEIAALVTNRLIGNRK